MLRRAVLLSILLLFLRGHTKAAGPATLQIRIEEGDGATYPAGSRATRGITVLVNDQSGNPVGGASVNFSLPENGPGGVFADGSKTQLLLTRADGRASVWGMRWNRQAGSFTVRIVAGKGTARAGTEASLKLTESSAAAASLAGARHKWLWIGLAAAGAAGIGIAAATRGGASSSNCSPAVILAANPCQSSPDTLGVTVIGAPTINLGHP